MKKLVIVANLFFLLCGCKIDFTGDLYTSDLINLANSKEEKVFNLPMEISYQVTSCEGTDSVNRIISTYFIEYNNTGCDIGEDYMSYAKAQVAVPVVNSYDIFNNTDDSLIGFVSYLSEDSKYVYVDATINSVLYESLKDYVYKETLQELSLTESNLSIRLNNDLNSVTVEVQPSFVNSEPIVFATEYVLERRELMIIEASNVNSAYLHKNLWTPLFLLINSVQN